MCLQFRSPSSPSLLICAPNHAGWGVGGSHGSSSRSSSHRSRSQGSRRGAVPQLRVERHHLARASRCARRPQARAAPHPLLDVPEPAPHGGFAAAEIGGDRRRRARQVSPARRRRRLRGDGAHGAGVLASLPAGAGRGQLRLARRRWRGGDALHRGAPDRPLRRDARRPRARHRPLPRQLRFHARRADRAAERDSAAPDERLDRHRRRHGDQHPAAQSEARSSPR